MKKFFGALRFLTTLPVPNALCGEFDGLADSAKLFPFIGLTVGVIVGAIAWCAGYLFGDLLCAVVSVISLIVITGGLHLDGLADTADGFLSFRERSRVLEIMKDSRIGAMGVIVIVCVLLVKVAALGSIPPGMFAKTVLLMAIAGRCAMMVPLLVLDYAKDEDGLGSAFASGGKIFNILWSAAFVFGAGWLLLGMRGVCAAAGAMLVTIMFTVYCKRKIGGYTGDTLGATCEIVEAMVPLVIAATMRL